MNLYVRKLLLAMLLFVSCNLCVSNAGAQALANTSWRAVGQLGQTFKQQGFDTLSWQFLSGDRLHWVGAPSSSSSTIYSLWWQTGVKSFKFNFQDTSANTSQLTSLCSKTDTINIRSYHISGDTLYLDTVGGGCSVIGSLLAGSTWTSLVAATGVNGIQAGNLDVTVYPLPANSSTYISISGYAAAARLTLSLYDNTGRKVKELSAASGHILLDGLGTLPAGIYTLHIMSEDGHFAIKKIAIVR